MPSLFGLVFGAWAGHPAPGILFMAAGNSLFVVCLALLLRRVIPEHLALMTAGLWAVLPAHTSLEVWLSCVNITWSQAAAALGLMIGWRTPRRPWQLAAAAALFLVAVLAYEATIVVALLAVFALPLIRDRRPDWPLVGATTLASVAGLAWVATHWFEGKHVARQLAPVADVLVANTGWPIVPPGPLAKILAVAAITTLALCGGRLLLPSFREGTGIGEWLVVGGCAVMLAGTVPFALYVYEPLGAGDRMNGLSAVGGALFLVGAGCTVAHRSRIAAGSCAVILLGAALVTRAERLWLWHLAGRDADAIVAAVVVKLPDPDGVIVLGPEPISNDKIVAFLEGSSITSALQLAYGSRLVEAHVAQDEQTFLAVPEHLRVDIRPLSELDGS